MNPTIPARSAPRPVAVALLGCALLLAPFLSVSAHDDEIPLDGEDSQALGFTPCAGGIAAVYPCRAIDIESVVPRAVLAAGGAAQVNDVWGWTDPQTGVEYALVGMEDGTVFVDLRDSHAPVVVGRLPTRTFAAPWRDVKVRGNHAYIVADTPAHGLQVFDLTRLRGASPGSVFRADATYIGPGLGANSGFGLGNVHNIAIEPESGFAFAVGSSTCGGGLHMIDINAPKRPRFAGCFGATGYTHDTQCVVYRGPDADHAGRQLCFNSDSEPSALGIVDVTDKRSPRLVSSTPYPGRQYAHQGWLSEDQRFFFLGDELDEGRAGHGTRTIIFDVTDLDAPVVVGSHFAPSRAIGHNMYTHGGRLYQANYTDGLTIYELGRAGQGILDEVASFDIVPASDETVFSGAWSVYPYFSSGLIVVSGISNGLFVLRPRFGSAAGDDGHHHDDDHAEPDHHDVAVPPDSAPAAADPADDPTAGQDVDPVNPAPPQPPPPASPWDF